MSARVKTTKDSRYPFKVERFKGGSSYVCECRGCEFVIFSPAHRPMGRRARADIIEHVKAHRTEDWPRPWGDG